MSTEPSAPRPHWIKRIGGAAALWAGICGVGLLGGMSPRPLLLAGLVGALSVAYWLAYDSIGLAEPTDWHITDDVETRPRGADAHVVALERVIADSATSPSSRLRLQELLTVLADERLSLRGIDRRFDPAGARAVMGQELNDFITTPDPGRSSLTTARTSVLLDRIESL